MWVALAALLGAAPAYSEPVGQSAAVTESRSIAEHNHLGLLEYCRDSGMIGDEAVAAQRRYVATLPGVDVRYQAAGRRGLIVFGDLPVAFVQSASAQGITVRFSCEQTALRVLRQQAGQ